jgi:peptidoglycan/xylan/chitin deacetylase (PgdA/CDA1 family)
MKIFKRIIFYFFVFYIAAGILWLGHIFLGERNPVILMYHSVGEDFMKEKTLNVSVAVFEKQMKFLYDHKYRVIPLMELVRMLEEKKKVPAKTIVLTFDDGYENNYTKAYPILKKYGLPAAIFVISDYLGREEDMYGNRIKFMTPEMARAMSDSGLISIQSHTKRHLFLPNVKDPLVLRDEIAGSKQDLERFLEKPVEVLCYPIGGYTPEIKKMARQAGYKAAVTTFSKRKCLSFKDLYALKRIKITENGANSFVFFIETSGYYLRMREASR